MDTCVPVQATSFLFEVAEEHPASNVTVGEQEERLLDVRRWDPHGRMKGWIDQILQESGLHL